MTDNGAAALAAALIKGSYLNGSWFDHEEECAAAILGERGAFLPDGDCGHSPEWAQMANGALDIAEEQAATIANLNAGEAEWHRRATLAEATIATLRAALEIIANATRTQPGEGYAISVSAHNIARHALATAKETP